MYSILRLLWTFASIFATTHLCLQHLLKFENFRRIFKLEQRKKQPELKNAENQTVKKERTGPLPLATQNLILRNLSPIDRYRYSLACRELHYAVCSFERQAYRIQHILLPYFTEEEINIFRLIQRKTDTLISGSTALQFFDLSVWDSDLDLYVVREWFFMLLAGFLISISYEYQPRPEQKPTFQDAFQAGRSEQAQHVPVPPIMGDGYSSRNIWDVYSFVRASDGKKIQIITCVHNTMQVILDFHSTCVMNVISYMFAYALYPFATFAEQETVAILRGRPHESLSLQRALDKYAERGWTTTLTPSSANALRSESEFRDTARSAGDSACWVIPLAPVEHAISLTDYDTTPSVDPVRANSWYTILTQSGQTRNGYKVIQLMSGNPEDAYAFTFPSIPYKLKSGSAVESLGEDITTFSRQT
ncbi:hypothetical protein BT96DRAFT_1103661 [Gymnopus androsaceus JB14]|uniref:F-box domain-containing protein n=1 Tax=Gymnopus androsaceus JB14 TaxID=1447944 RepID=A0A6A4ID05_9AGAR|nr:hypothetical protein BT96DRAFT_1103661 [Gymnopus androsaceus JB14]